MQVRCEQCGLFYENRTWSLDPEEIEKWRQYAYEVASVHKEKTGHITTVLERIK